MFDEKAYKKKWYLDHKEEIVEYKKQYYTDNKEKIQEYQKHYRFNHKEERKEKIKKYNKQYRINNKGKIAEQRKQRHIYHRETENEYARRWNIDHKEERKEYYKQWRKDNPEHHKKYMKYRRKTNLKVNLNHKISGEIYKSLKGNKAGRHWENLVGYSLDDLVSRLKYTMPEGYNWNDFLNGRLHIDHIIPISAHNYTKANHTDFTRCWNLNNLQLLPAKENLIKHNTLSRPFQPALQI
jgi:hypothetical protein